MKKKTQKIKRGIFVALAFGMLISNVYAITSDGVTYDNQGNTEVLTDTLDGLLREADKYKTGGTVTANQMLKGATGYAKGELVTGTIESKGAETYTPGTTNQTISSGVYLSGTQTIKGDANLKGANIAAGKTIFGVSGTFTSDANAAAGHILSGKTAYVNGSKVTGTIPSKGAATYTPGTSNQTINSGQYLNGTQTIAGDADLVSGNIKSGVNIFGVTGTHSAQNNNYDVIYMQRYQMNSGGKCEINVQEFTVTTPGQLIIHIAMDSVGGGVNNTYSDIDVSICKDQNGGRQCTMKVSATDYKLGGEYGKIAYWSKQLNAGDSVRFNMYLNPPGTAYRSCSALIMVVS